MSMSDQATPQDWESIPGVSIPQNLFEGIKDPRVERRRLHVLKDILAIALCATISGADGWEDMETFGISKIDWLQTWLSLPSGVPSADTFRRVIAAIKPKEFNKVLVNLGDWLREYQPSSSEDPEEKPETDDEQGKQRQVAIDGKCLCSATDEDHKRGTFYMVNAWSTQEGLALAQLKVNGKSNEITAIPEILKFIDVKGCVVSIDAAGAQKDIASMIIDMEGDYILALKGNQGKLHNEIGNYFDQVIDLYDQLIKSGENAISQMSSIGVDMHVSHEYGHGREEKREFFVTESIDWLPMKDKWKGLQSVIAVRSTRTYNGKTSVETRYYISSLSANAQKTGRHIREHWKVENCLHWVLDVGFNEDDIYISDGHAAENLSVLRSLSLSLLRRSKAHGGIKAKRKRAGWNTKFLMEVLMSNHF